MKTKDAADLITVLATINELFIHLSLSLRTKPELKQIHHGFNLRKYDNRNFGSVEIFVEAEIDGNLAYCWWLEVSFEIEIWEVDVLLLKTENGEQHTQSQLLEVRGKDMQEFFRVLAEAGNTISNSVQQHFSSSKYEPTSQPRHNQCQ